MKIAGIASGAETKIPIALMYAMYAVVEQKIMEDNITLNPCLHGRKGVLQC